MSSFGSEVPFASVYRTVGPNRSAVGVLLDPGRASDAPSSRSNAGSSACARKSAPPPRHSSVADDDPAARPHDAGSHTTPAAQHASPAASRPSSCPASSADPVPAPIRNCEPQSRRAPPVLVAVIPLVGRGLSTSTGSATSTASSPSNSITAEIRSGCMPFSGSSRQSRRRLLGSDSMTVRARNRSVPSDSALATCSVFWRSVMTMLKSCRFSSTSTATPRTFSTSSESLFATRA